MEDTILKDILLLVTILLLIVVSVLYYKDYKKRQFIKKCPKCNSNDLDKDMIFLRKEEKYISKAKDPRTTLTSDAITDRGNQTYFKVADYIYNVKYKCNNYGYEFSKEIIK